MNYVAELIALVRDESHGANNPNGYGQDKGAMLMLMMVVVGSRDGVTDGSGGVEYFVKNGARK